MNNKDLPAFPVECIYTEDGQIKGIQTGNVTGFEKGLSKREYMAAMAMQGLLANYQAQEDMQNDPRYNGNNFSGVVAINSVEFADALLKELEKQPVP